MAKKVAVLAVNPVNGFGLFQYLEAFYENGIPYQVFAVADTPQIETNSGIPLTAGGTVSDLKGHEDEYDALVFACGDAIPKFEENADAPYNRQMLEEIAVFGQKGKIMIGHCAAGLMFELAGITGGKNISLHPYVQGSLQNGVANNDPYTVDGQFYTAQTENTLTGLIEKLVDALK